MIPSSQEYVNESNEKLQERRDLLLSEITDFGKKLEVLDITVRNHPAHKEEYEKIIKDIEYKTALMDILNNDLKNMVQDKSKLITELSMYKVDLEQKKVLNDDIEKLKGIVKVLQQEEYNSKARYAEHEKKVQSTLKDSKEKLQFIHATVNSVISQLD